MSDIMTIEQLEETSASELVDGDLLMTSVRNSNGSYTSKKMTLNALADYVNSRGKWKGGYEIIDRDAMNEENYAWEQSNPQNEEFEKKFNKDSVVYLQSGVTSEYNNDGTYTPWVKIDDVDIYVIPFTTSIPPEAQACCKFYVKAGQKLTFKNTSNVVKYSYFPLYSGGEFFFDTSKRDLFENGTMTSDAAFGEWTYTAQRPTLLACKAFDDQTDTYQYKLNGKCIYSSGNDQAAGMIRICLREGDKFSCFIHSNSGGSTVTNRYAAYPLLVDGSGENKSCGYETYDLSDSDANYINGKEVGNDGFTKRFTRDCEILVTPSPVSTSYGNITVKVDNVQLCTGLFALGIGNLAQFYVKAGQTLSISRNSGTVKVYSRPLKSGGNFFIDGTETLSSPFTGIEMVERDAINNTFEFTAHQKTLFIYANPGAGAGLDSVKINNVEINWKYTTHSTSWHYDKLILDSDDTLTFTFVTSDYMIYCALPLLEA